MRRVDLLHAHGSPTGYLYRHGGCRCAACRGQRAARGAAYYASHREEEAARGAAYKADHREEVAARRLERRYDLLPGEWGALFASQGDCCGCCGDDDPGDKRGWHTDHDHKTGTVRGILCSGCNTGLGRFRDDPKRLMAAIEYLEAKS